LLIFLFVCRQVNARPSKSAQKKSSKVSRLEKKQQKSSVKSQRAGSPQTADLSQPVTSSQLVHPPKSHHSAKGSDGTEHVTVVHQTPMPPLVGSGSRSFESPLPNVVQVDSQNTEGCASSPPPIHSVEKPTIFPAKPVHSAAEKQRKDVIQRKQATMPQQTTDTVGTRESEKLKEKNRQNVVTRTLWTFIMIGGFIGARCPRQSLYPNPLDL
jgi:phosphatidate cytidylyltransferase